jgi:hypothetical protein
MRLSECPKAFGRDAQRVARTGRRVDAAHPSRSYFREGCRRHRASTELLKENQLKENHKKNPKVNLP